MKEVLHILTAVLAALLLVSGTAAYRDGTSLVLSAWTISQATGSYDTAQKRDAELSADSEPGASADGPGGPFALPATARRAHVAERDAEVGRSEHRICNAAANWPLPPATGPPFS